MKRKPAFTHVVSTICLVTLYSFSSVAFACTTDGWNGGVTGSPVADSPTTVSRVSGLCGMELAGEGSVKDISPVNESTFIARFYVKGPVDSGTPVIFEAFSDDAATASLISVTFDGSSFVFNGGSGNSAPIAGNPTGWNLVELSWTSSTGMSVWVNADSNSDPATDDSIGASGGTVESVVLGAQGSFTGTLSFDDYVSHRETPIGGVVLGDADNNAAVSLADATAILIEARPFGAVLAEGVPDCNLDGQVTLADASRVLQAARPFGAVPCGPDNN